LPITSDSRRLGPPSLQIGDFTPEGKGGGSRRRKGLLKEEEGFIVNKNDREVGKHSVMSGNHLGRSGPITR